MNKRFQCEPVVAEPASGKNCVMIGLSNHGIRFSAEDAALLASARNPISPELNEVVVYLCRRSWPDGFDTSETAAPETFTALKVEMRDRGRITINCANSMDSIYGSPEINIMSRAWHDWAHLQGGYGFDVNGEINACHLQCCQIKELLPFADTDRLCALLEADVVGQARYHQRHRQFVERQRDFVELYLTDQTAALSGNFQLETGREVAPSFD